MSENTITQTSPKGKRPTHTAYSLREYGENKKEWLNIGVAWQKADGSYDTQLYALPLDGRIVHRPIKDQD